MIDIFKHVESLMKITNQLSQSKPALTRSRKERMLIREARYILVSRKIGFLSLS
jgi:hypothetical protein